MAAKKESSSKQLPTGPAGDKKAALETALAQIEKQFGKGAVMKLGTNVAMQARPYARVRGHQRHHNQ